MWFATIGSERNREADSENLVADSVVRNRELGLGWFAKLVRVERFAEWVSVG